MQFREFGTDGAQAVVLLHGGALSWWNYRGEAALLEDEYRVILPILDGHAGSDRSFTSIEDNASEIISFLDARCGGEIALLGGLSLGAQIALEMLSQRGGLCRCALIESAMLIPSKLTRAMIAPAFSASYGFIKNRDFARVQARSLHIRDALFEEYYRDTCRIEKADMIAFMEANSSYAPKAALARSAAKMHIVVGEKETRGIRRSAELLRDTVGGSTLTVLPGLYHGEFSLSRADDYAKAVRELLREDT